MNKYIIPKLILAYSNAKVKDTCNIAVCFELYQLLNGLYYLTIILKLIKVEKNKKQKGVVL